MFETFSPGLIIAALILPILALVFTREIERATTFSTKRLSSQMLLGIFSNSAKDIQNNFLNQTLQVYGEVKGIEIDANGKTVVILESEEHERNIRCVIDPSHRDSMQGLTPGKMVELRGMCIGMIYDIVLVNTEIIKQRFLPTFL